MKVICIDGVKRGTMPYDTEIPASIADEVYEGEVYAVVKEKEYYGNLCYFLAERRRNAAYYAGIFIPLSNINENEIHQIEKLQPCNVQP